MKLVGIKIDKRYPDFDGDAEYVGRAVFQHEGLIYSDEIIDIVPCYETNSKEFTKTIKADIFDKYGKIPRGIPVKFEDVTHMDLRAGYPTTEVLLYDLGIIQ